MKKVVKAAIGILTFVLVPLTLLDRVSNVFALVGNLILFVYVLILLISGLVYGRALGHIIAGLAAAKTNAKKMSEVLRKVRIPVMLQTANGILILGTIVWNIFDNGQSIKHLVFAYLVHGAEVSVACTSSCRCRAQ